MFVIFNKAFSKTSKELLLYSFAIAIHFLILGPKVGYYSSTQDSMRLVIYGSPFPYKSYFHSSLEWEYDLIALGLNLLLLTWAAYFFLSKLRYLLHSKTGLLVRVLGCLLLLPLVWLGFWFWLSGFYEIVHYNAFEFMNIVLSGKLDSHTKLFGACISFDFHRYLDAYQGVLCRRN
jgi:hypothetical protein